MSFLLIAMKWHCVTQSSIAALILHFDLTGYADRI